LLLWKLYFSFVEKNTQYKLRIFLKDLLGGRSTSTPKKKMMKNSIWTTRVLVIGALTVSALTVAACGGGSSGSTSSSSTSTSTSTSTPTTFQAVATEGELVSYTVDTTARTYSYKVVESAYGKTGATGSGQLTLNSDGTYTPSGFNGKIAVLDSGLLLGAIYEDLNGDNIKEVVPVVGVSNPISSTAEAAGIYNFISRQCTPTCTNWYGTVKIETNGNWESCAGQNLANPGHPACNGGASGSISSFSAGRANLIYGGVSAGSMLVFKDPAGQKVILIDLNGGSIHGKGAVFAASQQLPASADGRWTYLHTDGTNGTAVVTGTNVTDSGVFGNGRPYSSNGSFVRNQPWAGFATTSGNSVILPAGSGLYVSYFSANSSMGVGVKK
jgi:hypothetical protein